MLIYNACTGVKIGVSDFGRQGPVVQIHSPRPLFKHLAHSPHPQNRAVHTAVHIQNANPELSTGFLLPFYSARSAQLGLVTTPALDRESGAMRREGK